MRRKGAGKPQKEISKGFALFGISIAISQALRLMYDILLSSGIKIFPRFIKIGGSGYEYIQVIFIILGLIFLINPIEKYILHKEKLTITKLNIITLILAIIPYFGAAITFDLDSVFWTNIAYVPLLLVITVVLYSLYMSFAYYIRLGIASTGRVRRKALLIGFGILIFWLNLFTPIFLDLIRIAEGQMLFVISSVISIFALLMIIIGSNNFYFEYLNKLKEEITVRDLKISKEQRICLVHKGKIQGKLMKCVNCKIIYCVRCFMAIKAIENVCWACNKSLDSRKKSKIDNEIKREPTEKKGPTEGKEYQTKANHKKHGVLKDKKRYNKTNNDL
jgi:hypothetical protein